MDYKVKNFSDQQRDQIYELGQSEKRTREWTEKFINVRCEDIYQKIIHFEGKNLQEDFVKARIKKQLRQRFDQEFVDFHDVRGNEKMVDQIV